MSGLFWNKKTNWEQKYGLTTDTNRGSTGIYSCSPWVVIIMLIKEKYKLFSYGTSLKMTWYLIGDMSRDEDAMVRCHQARRKDS